MCQEGTAEVSCLCKWLPLGLEALPGRLVWAFSPVLQSPGTQAHLPAQTGPLQRSPDAPGQKLCTSKTGTPYSHCCSGRLTSRPPEEGPSGVPRTVAAN